MELFACVTDMQGKGLPLSCLFITTEEDTTPLTKQRALTAWMTAIQSLGIDPWFTMSDKDQCEINALRQHQEDTKRPVGGCRRPLLHSTTRLLPGPT